MQRKVIFFCLYWKTDSILSMFVHSWSLSGKSVCKVGKGRRKGLAMSGACWSLSVARPRPSLPAHCLSQTLLSLLPEALGRTSPSCLLSSAVPRRPQLRKQGFCFSPHGIAGPRPLQVRFAERGSHQPDSLQLHLPSGLYPESQTTFYTSIPNANLCLPKAETKGQ